MSDTLKEPDRRKKGRAEKPVSLAGSPLKDVLTALLKTPKPRVNNSGKKMTEVEKSDR